VVLTPVFIDSILAVFTDETKGLLKKAMRPLMGPIRPNGWKLAYHPKFSNWCCVN